MFVGGFIKWNETEIDATVPFAAVYLNNEWKQCEEKGRKKKYELFKM